MAMFNQDEWIEVLCKAEEGDQEAMIGVITSIMADSNEEQFISQSIQDRYWKYLKILADAGHPFAYIWMGSEYENGVHVSKDADKAIECYQNAVKAGEKFGYECMAMLYYYGKLVPADYKKAYELFMKSGKRRSNGAKFVLGEMRLKGLYLKQSNRKACYYYKQITNDDQFYSTEDAYYWPACYRLGYAKHYGKGVRKNLDEARELMLEAQAHYYEQNPNNPWDTKVTEITREDIEKELELIDLDLKRIREEVT